jgi:PAS domain S-box-containing protein
MPRDIGTPTTHRPEPEFAQALLVSLLDISTDAIIMIDDRQCIRVFNSGAEAIFGYVTDEVLGQPVEMLLPERLRGAHKTHIEEFAIGLETSRRMDLRRELVGRRKDGSEFPAEASIERHGNDKAAVFTVILRDISERKRAEAALVARDRYISAVLENVADGVVTIDRHGLVKTVNPAAVKMFGFAADEILGENVTIFMAEPDRSHHDDYIRNYLKTGKGKILGIGPREVTGRHKDGSTLVMELSVGQMQDGDGPEFIGVLRDITDRKQTEELLSHAQKMDAVGQLTGGVAHDFNNLLTVILGNLDMVRDGTADAAASEMLIDGAIEASERGAHLTQQLLSFSRKQALTPEATDVNSLIPNMSELMGRTLGEDIDIETALADDLWKAMVDRGKLENAILNIALNARDAMPDGGRLTIETANADLDQAYADTCDDLKPGSYVLIAISDTGSGMPPEVIKRAFDPFFTTKGVGQGSGLGLSMVYGYAKQSGGHLAIFSEAGQGTTVRLYLPKFLGAEESVRDAASEDERLPTGDEPVLVVEDDEAVRSFLVAALRSLGYRVIEAADGAAALSIVEQAPEISLLVTDVVLPHGMNGQEVAEEVRKRLPNVKVLFTSGYSENAIFHHDRLEEGVELLTKPYSRATLAQRVRQVLDA